MRTNKEVHSVTLVIDKVFCNKCGAEIETHKSEIYDFKIEFGYFSKRDGNVWMFDLCESCLENLVESFVHQHVERRPF